MLDARRALFLDTVRRALFAWYQWGGQGPAGWDCSGLVIEGLRTVGAVPAAYDASVAGLTARWRSRPLAAAALVPGALVAYGTHHVVIVDTVLDDGTVIILEAGGGTPAIGGPLDAAAAGAYVRRRPLRPGYSAILHWWT